MDHLQLGFAARKLHFSGSLADCKHLTISKGRYPHMPFNDLPSNETRLDKSNYLWLNAGKLSRPVFLKAVSVCQ